VKLNGIVMAARQTDSSTSHLPAGPVLVIKVMDFPIRGGVAGVPRTGSADRNRKIGQGHFRQNSIKSPFIPE
jgi:hypothetical protein